MNLLFEDRENASRRAVTWSTCANTRPRYADTVAVDVCNCSGMLAIISRGPSGARSGSQTYWPGFSVTVSGETCMPSVKISAETMKHRRISKLLATARNEENKDFMVVNQ
jgi:hypothetical protein